jgi:ElaB/YqjD/DUF883 family membrane-anchored ribosome-binding protein
MSRINESTGNQGEQNQGSATDQLRDKATDVADKVRDIGNQATQAAQEQFSHLRENANEYFDQGREKAQQWQHELEEYVHEQPLKALLIAAGIGVVLGVLWKRS